MSDVTIELGDPDEHSHAWKTLGQDEAGGHTLTCDCGETGYGFGQFEGAP